jgi:hypothetical protein
MDYRQFGDYYCGWADLTIGEIATQYADFFANLSVLLTSLDSNSDLAGYGVWLKNNKPMWDVHVIGSSVWISPEHVQQFLFEPNTLSHFDEMYCLARQPPESFRIGSIFTSDRCNFSNDVPNSFLEIFSSLGALRYISDGCGLNFACENINVANSIAKIEQEIVN